MQAHWGTKLSISQVSEARCARETFTSHRLLSAGGQPAASYARYAGRFTRSMPHLYRSVAIEQPGNCSGIFRSDRQVSVSFDPLLRYLI